MSELAGYEKKFSRLHCDRPGGRPRPHKACMLLAVSVLAEAKELAENRIEYNPRLLEVFKSLLEVARQGDDKNTPYNPFFYLKSEGFWHLRPNTGFENSLPHVRTISGPGQLREAISHVELDPELFMVMQDAAARAVLQATLIQHYCSHAADLIWATIREESEIESCRQNMLKEAPAEYTTDNVRSTAFRRMIREIYDLRCCACGIRFFFEDVDLIDAAHLIPFHVSNDDRPQNGLALCKNHHWLMDHGIIAPGPGRGLDYQHPIWIVKNGLDDRFEEHRPVLELRHKTVILPSQLSYAPSRDAIDWRVERLKER